MTSTMIEERSAGAGDAVLGRLKILFFLPTVAYCVAFESLLRTMLAAGHRVIVALEHETGGPPQSKSPLFDALSEQYPGFAYRELPPRKDLWRIPAGALRRDLDYMRYLQPGHEGADALRDRAGERALRALRALLFLPPFRWEFGRRLVAWLLRRLEAGMPIPRAIRSFVKSEAPDVTLVSPLLDFGSAQGDYLRTADAARIPSVLVVASPDDLKSKGVIRDMPSLTLVRNEAEAEDAALLQGVPRERIEAVGGGEAVDGIEPPAAPAALEAIERAAKIEVKPRWRGRILRPLLWLLTPLLVVLLAILRPRASAQAIAKATRRLAGRISKRIQLMRRRRAQTRAERRKGRAQAAKEQKLAQAETIKQQKQARAEEKGQAKAEAEAARQERIAQAEAALREKQARKQKGKAEREGEPEPSPEAASQTEKPGE